jgi:hypothetical protein
LSSAPDPTPSKILETVALGELLAQSQRVAALERDVALLSARVATLERRGRVVRWPWLAVVFLGLVVGALFLGAI